MEHPISKASHTNLFISNHLKMLLYLKQGLLSSFTTGRLAMSRENACGCLTDKTPIVNVSESDPDRFEERELSWGWCTKRSPNPLLNPRGGFYLIKFRQN